MATIDYVGIMKLIGESEAFIVVVDTGETTNVIAKDPSWNLVGVADAALTEMKMKMVAQHDSVSKLLAELDGPENTENPN